MRVGVAHHFGWGVAVTAADDYRVVDRRRVALIEPHVPSAPIHHHDHSLDDDELAVLVAKVRASVVRATSASLAELAAAVVAPIVSLSLRDWPSDFPSDIHTQRRSPYESRADSVMYREVLAECACARGWQVVRFDAKNVEQLATALLGERAADILHGPRATLGPPWTKDHRMALAATILASEREEGRRRHA